MSGCIEIGTCSRFLQVVQVVSQRTGIPVAAPARAKNSCALAQQLWNQRSGRVFVCCRPGRPRLGPASAETHAVTTLVRKVRVAARVHGACDARTQWSVRPGRHIIFLFESPPFVPAKTGTESCLLEFFDTSHLGPPPSQKLRRAKPERSSGAARLGSD